DAYLTFVRRNDQKCPSVLFFLANPPVPPELVAIVLDRGALQGLEGDDDKLPRGFCFELGEVALEGGPGRGIENPGLVDHAAGEHGEGQCIGGVRDQTEEQSDNRADARWSKAGGHGGRLIGDAGTYCTKR